jgi:hypothetical protein
MEMEHGKTKHSEARVPPQDIPCGIYRARSGGSIGVSSCTSAFTSQKHSTNGINM